MKFYALADLHLGFQADKPMDVFGANWADHPERIRRNWTGLVADDDVVLVPGDISWAMNLPQAAADLAFLASLPGRKVVIRGNHDYWWQSIGKVRAALPAGIFALQNDHLVFGGVAICGTRGWNIPGGGLPGEDDPRVYRRERERLVMSLRSAPAGMPKIAMLHFPPSLAGMKDAGFTDILVKHGVAVCVYGHLHGARDHRLGPRGVQAGVHYVLAAADAVDFTPVRLPDLAEIAS